MLIHIKLKQLKSIKFSKNHKILLMQKTLTSINFNQDLFLFLNVNKTTRKMSSVHKYTCALGIVLKNHKKSGAPLRLI